MLRFEGRTSGSTTILGKPIPVGFKIFALADEGYIWNFEFTALGLIEGQGIGSISVSIPGTRNTTNLSNIQAVVIRLVSRLYSMISKDLSFHLYLDNLFIS